MSGVGVAVPAVFQCAALLALAVDVPSLAYWFSELT
jgi:hypothetical protein